VIERRSNPYHCKCESNGLDWDRCEVFTEDNPVSVFALKPCHIDSLLDDRVSIWVMGGPAEFELLYENGPNYDVLSNGCAMGRTR
jgi:hypothetical protein